MSILRFQYRKNCANLWLRWLRGSIKRHCGRSDWWYRLVVAQPEWLEQMINARLWYFRLTCLQMAVSFPLRSKTLVYAVWQIIRCKDGKERNNIDLRRCLARWCTAQESCWCCRRKCSRFQAHDIFQGPLALVSASSDRLSTPPPPLLVFL